jgi:rhamnulokinase
MQRFLAFDLGAESGRAVLGELDSGRLTMRELHRFANEPVLTDALRWDVLRLWRDMQQGLRQAPEVDGMGVCTWGVDYALLGENGILLENPYHYRDKRTDGVMEQVLERVSADEIYQQTGAQFMPINTLYQLYAAARRTPKLLQVAERFLTVPDLLNYWLSGVIACEYTNATTTQMFNPRTRDWAWPLLEQLDLPARLFGPVIEPGSVLARKGKCAIIAPACHDTGSAVAAIQSGKETAFISSGTWSLMGAEVAEAVITPEARALNFTNEGGVGGTIRLLKNIMGMWLLQSCRRCWKVEDYASLVALARSEPVFTSLIDPDDRSFLHPEDMPSAIASFCRETDQPVPATESDFVQCILESLALKYRYVLEGLQRVTGMRCREIRVVGGGARNARLNQYTADATGCRILAGPVEATALGNIVMQMAGSGAVASIAEARQIVAASFPPEVYEPGQTRDWDTAYIRFQQYVQQAVRTASQ